MDYTYTDIAKMIDHSLLNPTLTDGGPGERLPPGAATTTSPASASCPTTCSAARSSARAAPCRPARPSAFPTAATRRRSRSPRRSRRWPTAARNWTWSSTSARSLSGDWDYVRDDIAAVIERRPRRRPEGQSHLRELLPQRRAEDHALRNLRRTARGLGQDLHRLRHRRRDHRRLEADARSIRRPRPGQGRRRRPRPRHAARSPRARRHPRRRHPNRGNARRMPQKNVGAHGTRPTRLGPQATRLRPLPSCRAGSPDVPDPAAPYLVCSRCALSPAGAPTTILQERCARHALRAQTEAEVDAGPGSSCKHTHYVQSGPWHSGLPSHVMTPTAPSHLFLLG